MDADAGWRHQPALDGARALAVTAVLTFHARPDWLPGGFLGVDAFFVLSGYLITGLLLAEARRTGTVRLAAFWGRRARRLLPALLLTLVTVAVAARSLLPPAELAPLRLDALAALGYLANWRMIFRGGDYFAQAAPASPLQHTWSLGIEEQFYLVWPLLVAGLLRWRRSRSVLLALCVAGTAAAAALTALLYRPGGDPARVYYGTDTRAGALLVGCGLALLLAGRPASVGAVSSGAGSSGAVSSGAVSSGPGTGGRVPGGRWLSVPAASAAALLAAALLAVTLLAVALATADGGSAWLYRGGLTAVALAVALGLAHLVTTPAGLAARALSLPPVAWVGRVSYGLYLWHWPLYAALTADRTGLTGLALTGLRFTVTVLVAAASYYLVERPVRLGLLARPVPMAATAVGVTAALLVVAGNPAAGPPTWVSVPVAQAGAAATTGPPSMTPPSNGQSSMGQSSTGQSATGPIPTERGSPGPAPGVAPVSRAGRVPGAEPRIAVLGDSVAWTLGEYLLPVRGRLGITNRGVQGCGIARLPDIRYLGSPHTNYPGCDRWDERWRSAVDTDDPDVSVILLDRWELMERRIDGRYQHLGDPDYDAYVTGELKLAIGIASARGARVALLTAPYTHRAERPDGGLYPEDTPERVDAWNRLLGRVAAGYAGTSAGTGSGTDAARLTVLDLNRVICPGGSFTWSIGGLRVRSDGLHFTPPAVQQIIAPWLLPRLGELATTP